MKNFDVGQTVYYWCFVTQKPRAANYRGQINHAAVLVVDGRQFSIPACDVYGTPEEVKNLDVPSIKDKLK